MIKESYIMKRRILAIFLLVSIFVSGFAGCGLERRNTVSHASTEAPQQTETPTITEAPEVPDPDAYRPADVYTEEEFASEWLNLRYHPTFYGWQSSIEADTIYNNSTGNQSTFEMTFNNGRVDDPPDITVSITTEVLDGTTFEEEIEKTKQNFYSLAGDYNGTTIEVTAEPDEEVVFLGETYRLICFKIRTIKNSWVTRKGTVWRLCREKGDRFISINIDMYNYGDSLEDRLRDFKTYDGTESFHGFDKNETIESEETINAANTSQSERVEIGGTITFGSYEQDNNLSNGKEPIEWIVLDRQGDSAFVVSRYALDCQLYHPTMTNVTWGSCALRSWLNDTFYYSAFNADEQRMIQNAAAHTSWDDQVFLLSASDVNTYFPSDSAMTCRGTAYCYAQGAYIGTNDNCWWWLRSAGSRTATAVNVSSNGGIHYDGNDVDACAGAVRPAMWITVG